MENVKCLMNNEKWIFVNKRKWLMANAIWNRFKIYLNKSLKKKKQNKVQEKINKFVVLKL